MVRARARSICRLSAMSERVETGGQGAITAEVEQVVDLVVSGEKAPGLAR